MIAMAKLTLLVVVFNVIALTGIEVIAGTLPELSDVDITKSIFRESTENPEISYESETKNLQHSHVSHILNDGHLNTDNKTSELVNTKVNKFPPSQVRTEQKTKGSTVKGPETGSHKRSQHGNSHKISSKRNPPPKRRTSTTNSNKKGKVVTKTNNQRQSRPQKQTTSKSKTLEHKVPVSSENTNKVLNQHYHNAEEYTNKEIAATATSPFQKNTELLSTEQKWDDSTSGQGVDNFAKKIPEYGMSKEDKVKFDIESDTKDKNPSDATNFNGGINPNYKAKSDETVTSSYQIQSEANTNNEPPQKSQLFQSTYNTASPIISPEVTHQASVKSESSVGINSGKTLEDSLNKDNDIKIMVPTTPHINFDKQEYTKEQFVSAVPIPSKATLDVQINDSNDKFSERDEKKLSYVDSEIGTKQTFYNTNEGNKNSAFSFETNPSLRLTGEAKEFNRQSPESNLEYSEVKDIDSSNFEVKTFFNKEKMQNENYQKEKDGNLELKTYTYPNHNEMKVIDETNTFVTSPNVILSDKKIAESKNKTNDFVQETNLNFTHENIYTTEILPKTAQNILTTDASVTDFNKTVISSDQNTGYINIIAREKEGQAETISRAKLLSFDETGKTASKSILDEKSFGRLQEKSPISLLSLLIPRPKLSLLSGQFFIFGGSSDDSLEQLLENIIHAENKTGSTVTTTFNKTPNEDFTVGEFTINFASPKNTSKHGLLDSKLVDELKDYSFSALPTKTTDNGWFLNTAVFPLKYTEQPHDFSNRRGKSDQEIQSPELISKVISNSNINFMTSTVEPENLLSYFKNTAEDGTEKVVETIIKSQTDQKSSNNFSFEPEKKLESQVPVETSTILQDTSVFKDDPSSSSTIKYGTNLTPDLNTYEGKISHAKIEQSENPTLPEDKTAERESKSTPPNTDKITESEKHSETSIISEENKIDLQSSSWNAEQKNIKTVAVPVSELTLENSSNYNTENPLDVNSQEKTVERNTNSESNQYYSTEKSFSSNILTGNFGEQPSKEFDFESETQNKSPNTKNEWNEFSLATKSDVTTEQTHKFPIRKIGNTIYNTNSEPLLIENKKDKNLFANNPDFQHTGTQEDESENLEPFESTTDLTQYEDFTKFDENVSSNPEKSLEEVSYDENEDIPEEEINTYQRPNKQIINEEEYSITTASSDEKLTENENIASVTEGTSSYKLTGWSKPEVFTNIENETTRHQGNSNSDRAIQNGEIELNGKINTEAFNEQVKIRNDGTNFNSRQGRPNSDLQNNFEFSNENADITLKGFETNNPVPRDEPVRGGPVRHIYSEQESFEIPETRQILSVKPNKKSGARSRTLSPEGKGRRYLGIHLNDRSQRISNGEPNK